MSYTSVVLKCEGDKFHGVRLGRNVFINRGGNFRKPAEMVKASSDLAAERRDFGKSGSSVSPLWFLGPEAGRLFHFGYLIAGGGC